jgi:hypothetical protein
MTSSASSPSSLPGEQTQERPQGTSETGLPFWFSSCSYYRVSMRGLFVQGLFLILFHRRRRDLPCARARSPVSYKLCSQDTGQVQSHTTELPRSPEGTHPSQLHHGALDCCPHLAGVRSYQWHSPQEGHRRGGRCEANQYHGTLYLPCKLTCASSPGFRSRRGT